MVNSPTAGTIPTPFWKTPPRVLAKPTKPEITHLDPDGKPAHAQREHGVPQEAIEEGEGNLHPRRSSTPPFCKFRTENLNTSQGIRPTSLRTQLLAR